VPIFEFECKDCGTKFDVMISNKDKDKVACKACGSREVKQLLSMFATTGTGAASPANACQTCPSAGAGG